MSQIILVLLKDNKYTRPTTITKCNNGIFRLFSNYQIDVKLIDLTARYCLCPVGIACDMPARPLSTFQYE